MAGGVAPMHEAEGGAAATTFPLPLGTEPMEALTAAELPMEPGIWQYEPKWDGFRCLVFKSGAAVELRAKSGKPLTRYFPEVVEFLRTLNHPSFVVDGEIVIETGGVIAFDALQMRLHPAESRIRKLAAATPARLILFDMLAAGKQITIGQPLEQRRATLEGFMAAALMPDRLVISPYTRSRLEAQVWLNANGHGGTDGVVAKRLDDAYHPGKRTMVKVKRMRTADCVVGGFRYQSGSQEVGSLLLGLYDTAGKLNHVGFTSTISNAERPMLTRRLEQLQASPGFTGKSPGGPSRWSTERSTQWQPLRPELVVEVRFDQITGDRFRHGTKLLRWRPDKAPRQCTMEQIARTESSKVL